MGKINSPSQCYLKSWVLIVPEKIRFSKDTFKPWLEEKVYSFTIRMEPKGSPRTNPRLKKRSWHNQELAPGFCSPPPNLRVFAASEAHCPNLYHAPEMSKFKKYWELAQNVKEIFKELDIYFSLFWWKSPAHIKDYSDCQTLYLMKVIISP